jgi:hypothetical protein
VVRTDDDTHRPAVGLVDADALRLAPAGGFVFSQLREQILGDQLVHIGQYRRHTNIQFLRQLRLGGHRMVQHIVDDPASCGIPFLHTSILFTYFGSSFINHIIKVFYLCGNDL